MPIYEYRCKNNHQFELRQGFDAATTAPCPMCKAMAQRLIIPPAVHYKGSGFYTTDYGRSSGYSSESKKDSGDTSSGSPTKEAVTKAAEKTQSETKSESKTEAKPTVKPTSPAAPSKA